MARQVGKLASFKIVRIADSWIPFSSNDSPDLDERLENKIESRAAKIWSQIYLR